MNENNEIISFGTLELGNSYSFLEKISWQQPFSGLNELFNSPPGLNNNTFKSHSSNCGKICLVPDSGTHGMSPKSEKSFFHKLDPFRSDANMI